MEHGFLGAHGDFLITGRISRFIIMNRRLPRRMGLIMAALAVQFVLEGLMVPGPSLHLSVSNNPPGRSCAPPTNGKRGCWATPERYSESAA